MKTAGYTEADDRRYSQIQKNEFSTGGTSSLMSISDFGSSCQTTPEELKEALTVKDTELLKSICRTALEEEIAKMEKFKRKMAQAGIDLTREFDPLSFAQELRDKGLSSPKVFHAVLEERDSDDIPNNNEPSSLKKQPKPH